MGQLRCAAPIKAMEGQAPPEAAPDVRHSLTYKCIELGSLFPQRPLSPQNVVIMLGETMSLIADVLQQPQRV